MICTKCILDSKIPNIVFDAYGVCNYCRTLEDKVMRYPIDEKGELIFSEILKRIKIEGKTQEYDCIIGVSGGFDSSYLLHLLHSNGIRPLAVHFDNGWNSEDSVRNLKILLDKLGVELFTYVVEWEEFKKLQVGFLRASVPDVEVLTDWAITKILINAAKKFKIKTLITGGNFRTEGIIPRDWTYFDVKYFNYIIKNICQVKLSSYPKLTFWDQIQYNLNKNKFVDILNYKSFNKAEILVELKEKYDYNYYGGKHYESVFTRWFQGIYLPKKFNIDKRLIHLSALICSNQISREEALNEMKKPTYPLELQKKDEIYIMKKLELNESDYDEIMNSPPKSYKDFPNMKNFILKAKKFYSLFRHFDARP